jgi:putative isomerase
MPATTNPRKRTAKLAARFGNLLMFAVAAASALHATTRPAEYQQAQKRLASGWNTWDPRSVLMHVLLPEGLAIRIELHDPQPSGEQVLQYAQIGRTEKDAEIVRMGDHAMDGSYTDVTVQWREMTVRVQSATIDGDLLLLITPLHPGPAPARISVVAEMSWNRPGSMRRMDDQIEASLSGKAIRIFSTASPLSDSAHPQSEPRFTFDLNAPLGISTGKKLSLSEITRQIELRRIAHEQQLSAHGGDVEVLRAIEAAVAWNTVYDPVANRVLTGVSRPWDVNWGGYALGEWDTFFAAYMAAEFSRDLAYANTIEMLNEMTPAGFVPNYSAPTMSKSFDRSEPPIGSWAALELYKKFHDRWFLETVFPDLLRWNRWWQQHRVQDGYLVWGSDPVDPRLSLLAASDDSINALLGAKLESGLDNLCMWDGTAFDLQTHHMLLADVGLISLYIVDSDALATIAKTLGHPQEAAELQARAKLYRGKLAELWSEPSALYLDKDLRDGKPWPQFSPTTFYPLLARAATPQQAERLVQAHLLNEKEFWGEWVIPACPRNAPAFKDQDYWRGRIWGSMNFLVYLGLRNYALPEARHALAQRSRTLLMKEWTSKRHVHENYNGSTGEGDDVESSDRFYHWGALLGMIWLLDQRDALPDAVN